jgi:hypothetical protein
VTPHRRGHIRYLTAAVALALGLGACGGGGGGHATGPDPNAPVVTDLQVRALTPERANTVVRHQLTITVSDRDNDLVGGQVEVKEEANGHVVSAPITVAPANDRIFFEISSNPVPAGHYDLALSVIDAAGHRSNAVGFSITITPQVRPDGAPEMPRGGTFIDSLTPGRR